MVTLFLIFLARRANCSVERVSPKHLTRRKIQLYTKQFKPEEISVAAHLLLRRGTVILPIFLEEDEFLLDDTTSAQIKKITQYFPLKKLNPFILLFMR